MVINMHDQNPPVQPETSQPVSPQPSSSRKKSLIVILVVIIVIILVLAIGALAGYFVYMSGQNIFFNQKAPTISDDGYINNTAVDQNQIPSTTTESQTFISTADSISWNTPKLIESLKIFRLITAQSNDSYAIDQEKEAKYYKVGTVKEGKYKGGDIILVSAPIDGPTLYPGFYRLIKTDNGLVLLKKYSDDFAYGSGIDQTKLTVDENYTISQLDFPKIISGSAAHETLEIYSYVNAFFSLNNLKKVFTSPVVGDVYTGTGYDSTNADLFQRNGFYVQAPDGTVRIYALKIDFMANGVAPAITWSDGSKNKDSYGYTDHTGCGAANFLSILPESLVNDAVLKKTGKSSLGDSVYEFKDSNNAVLKDLYNNKYQVMDGQKKISYQSFIASHPIFFWKNPFGSFVKFENLEYGPIAECGKPVIYLYPTVAGKFSVQVEPQGGMTYSDPAYNSGWNVWSDTNSNLTDLSSGAKYPYLFWEGRGGIYQQPEKGFVIKKSEVHKFLIEKLSLLGLNGKETADFMEFWEPRMQSAPYYFVTFLGTAQMDQLAPLTINPKPDIVIRILMDFSPLQKPIKVQGYNIKTPVRTGFTVVEWGGVIR